MKKIISLILFIQLSVLLNAQILVPYRIKDKYGYSDTLGTIKIIPKYSNCEFFYGNTAKVYKQKKYTLINKKGEEIFNFFDEINERDNNYAIVTSNKKSGIVKGKRVIIPLIYDELYSASFDSRFENKQSAVIGIIKDKKYLIEYTKNKISKIKFSDDQSAWAKESVMDARIENVDYSIRYEAELNQLVRDKVIDSFKKINEKIYLVSKTGKYGLYKASNYTNITPFVTKFINCKYDEIKNYQSNEGSTIPENFVAKFNGKYGLIGNNDNEILAFDYDGIDNSHTSYILLHKNNKVGCYIFNTVYKPIEVKYDKMEFQITLGVSNSWGFSIFKVEINGRSGYVGENGIEFFKD